MTGGDGSPTITGCPLCGGRLNMDDLIMGREGKAVHLYSTIDDSGVMETPFTLTCPHCGERFNMHVTSDVRTIEFFYESGGQGWGLEVWKKKRRR